VTADHGHTPFVAVDRKVDATGLGQRFSHQPADGAIEFRNGPLPRQPLHLLARFGAWFGQQRRGYHGGAGLEEVAVPFAFLGRVRGEQEGRPRAPTWWWSVEHVAQLPPVEVIRATAAPMPVTQPAVVAIDARLASLTPDEQRVVALLSQNQEVRLSAVVQHLKKPAMRVSGLMQQMMAKMADLGCRWVTVEVLPDGDRLYRYQEDRGDR
jgi:hypothetical protein